MKALAWIVPCLCLTVVAVVPHLNLVSMDSAQAAPEGTRWEYKHVLIPLDRRLHSYEESDIEVLKPLRELGRDGWELVTAYEPPGGFTVNQRASVEFWLKRPTN